MSNKLDHNERYLQDLSKQQRQVPPPPVWESIEQELDSGQNRKPLFPYFWMIGLTIVVAIGFWAMQDTSVSDETFESKTQLTNATSSKQTSSLANESDSKSLTTQSTANTLSQDSSTPVSKTINQTTYKIELKLQPQSQQNEIPQALIRETQRNVEGTETLSIQPSTSLQPISSVKQTVGQSIKYQTNRNTSVDKAKTHTPSIHSLNLTNSISAISDLSKINPLLKSFVIDFVQPSFDHRLLPAQTFQSTDSQNHERTLSPWFIEWGGGIGREMGSSSLNDIEKGQYRIESESKWYSWSSAFHIGYQFKNNWYSKLGVEINQSKEKFEFYRDNVTSLFPDETSQSSFQTVKGQVFSIGEIRYTYVDLSIQLGYRHALGKSYLSFEGGLIYNMDLHTRGKVRIDDMKLSRIENEDYFKSKVGLGGRISLSIDYPIGEHLWLSFGPSYHQYLQEISNASNPLGQKSSVLKAKMRVRYHF